MTWVRLDEGFPEHPKIAELSDAAFRLHVEGLCYCARMLTDGEIPAVIAKRMGHPRTRKVLVDSGLWVARPNGSFSVHHYLDYQMSRTEIEDRRDKRSKAGKQGAQARWNQKANDMASAISDRIADASPLSWQNDAPIPNPIHNPSISVNPSPEGGSALGLVIGTDHFEIKDKSITPAVVASMERLLERLPDATQGTVGRLVNFAKAGAAQADFEDARYQVAETHPRSPSRVACHVIATRLRDRA